MSNSIPVYFDDGLQAKRTDIDEFVRMLLTNQVFIDNVLDPNRPKEWVYLTIEAGEGTTTQKRVQVPINSTFKDALQYIAEPHYEYHVFSHWSLQEGGPAIADDYVLRTDCPIWANYKRARCRITFDGNLGLIRPSVVAVDAGTKWSTVCQMVVPYRVDHALTGYAISNAGDVLDETFIVENDMYVYAIWHEWSKFAITFNTNGGEPLSLEPIYAEPGVKWKDIKNSVTSPKIDGRNFCGWSLYNEAEQLNPLIKDNQSFSASTTLFAQYSRRDFIVLVAFDSNGGSEMPPVNMYYGSSLEYLYEHTSTPGRDGYQFLGWALTSNAKEPLPKDYLFTEATTLYAVWKEVTSSENKQ